MPTKQNLRSIYFRTPNPGQWTPFWQTMFFVKYVIFEMPTWISQENTVIYEIIDLRWNNKWKGENYGTVSIKILSRSCSVWTRHKGCRKSACGTARCIPGHPSFGGGAGCDSFWPREPSYIIKQQRKTAAEQVVTHYVFSGQTSGGDQRSFPETACDPYESPVSFCDHHQLHYRLP